MSHSPRKRFGQHFLHDHGIIDNILSAFAAKKGEHIVEIGPGQGALTFPLLRSIQEMDAIELDRDLIDMLRSKSKRFGTLHVHPVDVLTMDFHELKQDSRLLRIIGNLPYNISTPLIFHLIHFADVIADIVCMVQKEVGERLAALPGSDHYGRLSVMVQYHCAVQCLFPVPPSAFFPPPQVDSIIVHIVPYAQLPVKATDEILFADIVKQAFQQRRKTLRNSLRGTVSDTIWTKAQIDPSDRAENLSVTDFVRLANVLQEEKEHGNVCNR